MLNKPINLETTKDSHPFKVYSRKFIKANFYKISQREIARILNIGKTTVNKWARSMDLVFVKDTVNEDYFHIWSRDMAYILGFICADGSVAWNPPKGYYSLTITAAEKDRLHLEKIRQIIDSTKPLLYSQTTRSYRLVVNSRRLSGRLIALGVVPRKSLILKFPKVPIIYVKDFIRGYMDGDGSVIFFKRKRSPYFEIRISSGSSKFLEILEAKVNRKLQIRSRLVKLKGNCYILRYSCTRGLKLANWLYQNAQLFLVRKYNKYQEAISPRKEYVL